MRATNQSRQDSSSRRILYPKHSYRSSLLRFDLIRFPGKSLSRKSSQRVITYTWHGFRSSHKVGNSSNSLNPSVCIVLLIREFRTNQEALQYSSGNCLLLCRFLHADNSYAGSIRFTAVSHKAIYKIQAVGNGIIYVSGINESGFLIDMDCLRVFPFYANLR